MKKIVVLIITLFFTGMIYAQTKTEVKVTDLPKSISAFISKNMEGFTIDKAFKVLDKGVQTYDVFIKNGDKKHVVAFDKDGNFLKKAEKDAVQKSGDQVKTSTPVQSKPSVPAVPTPTQPSKK